jgi:glycosyltransferase involved in cell wall biosynthesis
MPDRPTVSIIIATRDCLARLPRAIASTRDAPDAEIVVVDDDSADGTLEWLSRAAQTDPRLRVLIGAGTGAAKTRNMAIGAARGRLLAFLDPGDVWREGKLAAQLALLQANPDVAFCFTDYENVDAHGAVAGPGLAACAAFQARYPARRAAFVLADDALAQIYAEPIVQTSTVVARTELVRQLGGFDPDLLATDEWDLWLRLAARGKVGCIGQELAEHSVTPGSYGIASLRRQAIGMRMIAARHGASAQRLNHHAARRFNARLLGMDADIANTANHRWQAAWLRAKAWRQSPSAQTTRAAAAALQRAMSIPGGAI